MGVYVIGAGGHAKVVLSVLRANGTEIVGLLEEYEAKIGVEVMGCRVVGTVAAFSGKSNQAVIAIGDNAVRQRIAQENAFDWVSAIHPKAVIDPTVTVGAGTVVFAGAIVQPMTHIGEHAILNTASSVDHDCRIGDYCHVGPGAHLAGTVTLEDGAFVGCGASIVPQIRLGEGSVVGAGAVVIRDVQPKATVIGNPARPLGSST